MTEFRKIVNIEYAKAKQLSAQRKLVKAELNAAYAKYKKFMTETYKPSRKAVFEAITKAKADRKASIAAKKTAKSDANTAEMKATPKKAIVKTQVKKSAVKKVTPAAK